MRIRFSVALMTALLALYLVLVGQRAVVLVVTGVPVAIAMGCALTIVPVVGAWALGRELIFGVRSERLVQTLTAERALPEFLAQARPPGRTGRKAATTAFASLSARVEEDPKSWRAWCCLGIAYDASGDRRRARQSIRRAIDLSRDSARRDDRPSSASRGESLDNRVNRVVDRCLTKDKSVVK